MLTIAKTERLGISTIDYEIKKLNLNSKDIFEGIK